MSINRVRPSDPPSFLASWTWLPSFSFSLTHTLVLLRDPTTVMQRRGRVNVFVAHSLTSQGAFNFFTCSRILRLAPVAPTTGMSVRDYELTPAYQSSGPMSLSNSCGTPRLAGGCFPKHFPISRHRSGIIKGRGAAAIPGRKKKHSLNGTTMWAKNPPARAFRFHGGLLVRALWQVKKICARRLTRSRMLVQHGPAWSCSCVCLGRPTELNAWGVRAVVQRNLSGERTIAITGESLHRSAAISCYRGTASEFCYESLPETMTDGAGPSGTSSLFVLLDFERWSTLQYADVRHSSSSALAVGLARDTMVLSIMIWPLEFQPDSVSSAKTGPST